MKGSMTGQKSDILEDCSVFGNLVITLISLTSDSILQPLCTLKEFKRPYLSLRMLVSYKSSRGAARES
jgi:hypothetical protein